MNVIVSNKNKGLLNTLDVDVIKSINGEFSADEIIGTFSNFFFNRMFLDITAIKDYNDISNIQKLSMGLDIEKVIILLDNSLMADNNYLSKLISVGIYNFANNKESLMYLYNHPNSYKDVAHIHQLGGSSSQIIDNKSNKEEDKKGRFFGFKTGSSSNNQKSSIDTIKTAKIIGFKNMTSSAGATTLVYMLKKYLGKNDYVVALEIGKNDFGFFNEKDMFSINQVNLSAAISKFNNASRILIDLNSNDGELCDEVIYLLEPSTIKLNKMMVVNKDIFDRVYGKKIILNKSLLSDKDVKDFEFESHSQIAYNMPPLNDREDNNDVLSEFVQILDL